MHKSSERMPPENPSWLAPAWRRRAVAAAIAVVLLGGALMVRPLGGGWARSAAERSRETGALGDAERWLEWANRLQPDDPRNDLLRAAIFRELGDRDAWEETLATAKQHGLTSALEKRERILGSVRWGEVDRDLEAALRPVRGQRLPAHEMTTTLVQGLLAQGRVREARGVLGDGRMEPDRAYLHYLRGLCSWSAENRDDARRELEDALRQQPTHELARASLARLLEQLELPSLALPHYLLLLRAAPARETYRVSTSRVLRKLGRLDDSRVVLPPPASTDQIAAETALELAEQAYESGDYQEARRWFELADLEGPHIAETLLAAATAMALGGDGESAARLFRRIEEAQDMNRQVGELQRRLQIDPADRVAANELQHWMTRLSGAAAPGEGNTAAAEPVSPLYARHCAACHGVNGDGRGPAAVFLEPRPRNLRRDRYRLISTLNGVASREDLVQVIRQGIPGAAMPPLPQASEADLQELAEQVAWFRRAGAREALLADLAAHDQPLREEDLQPALDALTVAAGTAPMPSVRPATEASIQRGQALYLRLGCSSCHGDDGSGKTSLPLFDEHGRPVLPRDLIRDPLKGGPELESLWPRLRLGMPGTPHPAVQLSDDELLDLADYCRSLQTHPPRVSTNHQRRLRAATGGRNGEPEAPPGEE